MIGISGGIGSGKSFVADLFGELGCFVIHSDDQITDAYKDPVIRNMLVDWWGCDVYHTDGAVDRSLIAAKIFNNPKEKERLERLLHPWVNAARDKAMLAVADNPQVIAFVWDTPLLFETQLDRQCDVTVFVEAPLEMRMARLKQNRGWNETELPRRENLQIPLDKKREIVDYVVVNTADADNIRRQVREILSRTLANR